MIPDQDLLKRFLDEKVAEYNQPFFILQDPVSIPHLFERKQDIEIAGFFAATFSWGNRKTILAKCRELLGSMDNAPHDFCVNYTAADLKKLQSFSHRTFNTTDLFYFLEFFKFHYSRHDSLESAFFNASTMSPGHRVEKALNYFYDYFFSLEDVPDRTRKHAAAPRKNSACKRLNMFLRWMVRSDDRGIDFGIWKSLSPAELICPVDVHVARVARRLGLMESSQLNWRRAVELTGTLSRMDPKDPVKYDFALFGLGIFEKY